jgi:hypothetical protein
MGLACLSTVEPSSRYFSSLELAVQPSVDTRYLRRQRGSALVGPGAVLPPRLAAAAILAPLCIHGGRLHGRAALCRRRHGQRPEARGQRPEAGGQRPEAGGRRPEARGRRPEARGQRPEAGGRRPEARGRRPEARGQRPEAGGQRPEARGQRPEARGPCYCCTGQRASPPRPPPVPRVLLHGQRALVHEGEGVQGAPRVLGHLCSHDCPGQSCWPAFCALPRHTAPPSDVQTPSAVLWHRLAQAGAGWRRLAQAGAGVPLGCRPHRSPPQEARVPPPSPLGARPPLRCTRLRQLLTRAGPLLAHGKAAPGGGAEGVVARDRHLEGPCRRVEKGMGIGVAGAAATMQIR